MEFGVHPRGLGPGDARESSWSLALLSAALGRAFAETEHFDLFEDHSRREGRRRRDVYASTLWAIRFKNFELNRLRWPSDEGQRVLIRAMALAYTARQKCSSRPLVRLGSMQHVYIQ